MASVKADSVHPEGEIDPNLPSEDRLKEAAAQAEKAIAAQGMANSLRQAAQTLTDPKKREKMLTDAYNKEVEAHGSSKKARMLQSGAFQGSIGGAGIGGAVSAGVGTLVGTVVGTVTAIPATGLGALAGAGVGAIHGPFIKLGSLATGGKKDGKKGEKKDGEDKEDGSKMKDSPDDEDAVPDPAALRQTADLIAEERRRQEKEAESSQQHADSKNKGKKKPRKIEIRSGKQPEAS